MKEKELDYYIYYSLLITVIVLTLLYLIFIFFIKDYSIFYCFIYEHFHIYCPGCGATRAFIALTKGNIIQSIIYNPLVFYAIATTGIYLIAQTIDRIFKRKKHLIKYNNKYIYIGIIIAIGNCIIRNILLLFFNITI